MILPITESYLWLPVDKERPEVTLHFYQEGKKIQEIDIHLGRTEESFYTWMDVSPYLGTELEIQSQAAEELLCGIFCYRERVQNVYPFRPQLHFSPEIGWHNDPNGLVYADGYYHLYYQWNPYGVVWGNMHWGHGVSKDLIHWEHRPMAMAPDEYGTAYSGCGWVDEENTAGYGKGSLLFYYTAAGGRNQWSADQGMQFTQRLKVSTDGGETLFSTDRCILEHVSGENRDPKIFFHKESNAYIMVLYLDGYEFAIYRSQDLLSWKEASRLSMKGMWECPDLFALDVENEEGGKKWVFWSADGYYVVGSFDGYTFTPESEVQMAYSTRLPYAAQSYAGVKGRVISVAWLRMENDRGNYRGLMSLPVELSLVREENGYRTKIRPVRELWSLRQPGKELAQGLEIAKQKGEDAKISRGERQRIQIPLQGAPMEVAISWEPQSKDQTRLFLGNYEIIVDFSRETISFCDQEKHVDTAIIPFCRRKPLSLTLIIDQEVIEFFGNDGIIYGAVEAGENVLRQILTMESDVRLQGMRWCELKGGQQKIVDKE